MTAIPNTPRAECSPTNPCTSPICEFYGPAMRDALRDRIHAAAQAVADIPVERYRSLAIGVVSRNDLAALAGALDFTIRTSFHAPGTIADEWLAIDGIDDQITLADRRRVTVRAQADSRPLSEAERIARLLPRYCQHDVELSLTCAACSRAAAATGEPATVG